MRRRKLAIAVNAFMGVMTIAAWLFMSSFAGGSALQAGGLASLKFFTVQSNLLNGAVALLYAYWLARGEELTLAKRVLKLVAASAVGLTFVTVMVFLAPLYGYAEMMAGSNLWFHLLLPLLSFVSFVVLEDGPIPSPKATVWAVVPPALYAAGYVGNIALNGMGGAWPDTNDFYTFLAWGPAIGAVIAAVILLVTWLIAVVLRTAAQRCTKAATTR